MSTSMEVRVRRLECANPGLLAAVAAVGLFLVLGSLSLFDDDGNTTARVPEE